jgi:hypothetical protein
VFIVDSDRNVCEDLVGGRVIAVGRFVEPTEFSGGIAAIRHITQNGSDWMAVGKPSSTLGTFSSSGLARTIHQRMVGKLLSLMV